MKKIKVTYYRKLSGFTWFKPDEWRRFSKEDRRKMSRRKQMGIPLIELGYPVFRDRNTFYLIEEPK